MLCQAYETYANGLSRSNSLLRELRNNPDFMNFIRSPCSDDGQTFSHMTLSSFINRPVQHIQSVYSALGDLLSSTPSDSPDLACLQQIVLSMSHCVAKVAMPGHCVQQLSLTTGSLASLSSTCSDDSQQTTDPQLQMVQDIQERLTFNPDVPVSSL